MRAKNGSIIGKRNWWTTSKHKHTKRRCGTRRPVSCVSLLQRSPGTRYCGNERASAVRAGLYILNKKKCVRACLWGCTRMPAGGRKVSEEAFRKALIAVPLFSPAVTPSSALRLSSLITHTGNTTLIRDSTTSPNHTLTRLWPKCQNVHAGVFVCVCASLKLGTGSPYIHLAIRGGKAPAWTSRAQTRGRSRSSILEAVCICLAQMCATPTARC